MSCWTMVSIWLLVEELYVIDCVTALVAAALRFAKDQTQLVGEWENGKITSGKRLGNKGKWLVGWVAWVAWLAGWLVEFWLHNDR